MFIKTTYNGSIKVIKTWKKNATFICVFRYNNSCYFFGKRIILVELKGCVTWFIYFLDLLYWMYNCAEFHNCGICVTDFWFQEGLSWIELIKRIGHFQGYHIICRDITWWSSLPLRLNNSCRSVFNIIFWIMWFYHQIFCWETIIILGLTMKAVVFQPQTELSNTA